MANLTPKQQDALEWVATTDERYRKAKYNARTELKRLIEERVAEHGAARAEAVVQAYELGVPKSRIGQEGLHTTSPNTVYEILENHRKRMELAGVNLAAKPVAPYSWGVVERYFDSANYAAWALEDGVEIESVAVDWVNPGYAVLALGAKGYRLNVGEDMLGEDEFQTQYPELFAWVQENPPAAPEATEPVNPEPVAEEWEEEEYDD